MKKTQLYRQHTEYIKKGWSNKSKGIIFIDNLHKSKEYIKDYHFTDYKNYIGSILQDLKKYRKVEIIIFKDHLKLIFEGGQTRRYINPNKYKYLT